MNMPCKYSPLGFIMLDCDKLNCHSNICNASNSEYKICVRYRELEDGINLTPKQLDNLKWLNDNGYSASLTQNQAEMLGKVKFGGV